MLKVYVAGPYHEKEAIKRWAGKLIAEGFAITSDWIYGEAKSTNGLTDLDPEYLRNEAVRDLEDIDRADILIFWSLGPETKFRRGGRHVEFGYALAQGKHMVVVGEHENVFHHHPGIVVAPDLTTAIAHLKVWYPAHFYQD